MAFKLFAGVLLVFAISNFVFFIKAPLMYHSSLRALRKLLYTLFVSAIILGLIIDEISISNWSFLLTLTTVVVFIDLSLLLTPSILKLWKAEFQYTDYVENVIKANDRIHMGTISRVGTMSDMIQNAGSYFFALQSFADENRKKQLETYLKLYADQYGFVVQVWDVIKEAYDINRIPTTEQNQLRPQELIDYMNNLSFLEGIEKVVSDIERLNSFHFGEQKESYIQSLFHLEIVSLIEENSMVVPVFMGEDDGDMILVLKTVKGELLEVDAIHITNLVYLFYSFR